MYKDTQVVMLSTEKAKHLEHTLWLNHHNKLELTYNISKDELCKPQHLYFLSDEEIKEGDWCYNFVASYVVQIVKLPSILTEECSKIIATTDESLKVITGMVGSGTGVQVSQIPQSFLPIYVKAYNEGNIIDKVGVEYEWKSVIPEKGVHVDGLKLTDNNKVIIKVEEEDWFENLPDFTIHTEKLSVKEIIDKHGDELTVEQWKSLFAIMYSREEVERLIQRYRIHAWDNGSTIKEMEEWIKENLK